LAEASSGEITNCLPFPYDEFNGPLRLVYLSLIRRSLKVTDSGDWELLAAKTKLSGGKVPFSADAWHNLQLAFFENKISVVIDGAQGCPDRGQQLRPRQLWHRQRLAWGAVRQHRHLLNTARDASGTRAQVQRGSPDPAPNTWLSPASRIIDNQGTGIIESPRGGARVPRRLVGAASLVDP